MPDDLKLNLDFLDHGFGKLCPLAPFWDTHETRSNNFIFDCFFLYTARRPEQLPFN